MPNLRYQPLEKRPGSTTVYSPVEPQGCRRNDWRTEHRRQMKDPKRLLRMVRTAHGTISKNARRALVKKIKPRQSWKAAHTIHQFKKLQKIRMAEENQRLEEERLRRERLSREETRRRELEETRHRGIFSLFN